MSAFDGAVDGAAFLRAVVHHFYVAVADDPVLRPMYPVDLAPAEERLALFLIQYFGGDRGYERLRGEPRLRMRHLRFPIDRRARDAWMACMDAGIAAALAEGFRIDPSDVAVIREYLDRTATFLMNQGLSIVGT
jgi:hemoglobin